MTEQADEAPGPKQLQAALLAILAARYPLVFSWPPKVPLAIGIDAAVREATGADPFTVHCVLRGWTQRTTYLRSVASGYSRKNLDGSVAGHPTPSQRAHAAASYTRLADYLRREKGMRVHDLDPRLSYRNRAAHHSITGEKASP
jgi:sRNA-binding protein